VHWVPGCRRHTAAARLALARRQHRRILLSLCTSSALCHPNPVDGDGDGQRGSVAANTTSMAAVLADTTSMTASEVANTLSMQSLASSVPQAGEGLAGAPSAEASDLAFDPSDEYNYAQHLMPIGEGTFIQRAGVVRSTADDAASRAEMDDDLWAALHGDDGEAGEEGEEAQEAEEAFIEDLLEVQR